MFNLLQHEVVLDKKYCLKIFPVLSTQAPVVQRLDRAILWINHNLGNNGCGNELSYLVDSGLSRGYCFSLFQQPGPRVLNVDYCMLRA